jgi:hypothetical protein
MRVRSIVYTSQCTERWSVKGSKLCEVSLGGWYSMGVRAYKNKGT